MPPSGRSWPSGFMTPDLASGVQALVAQGAAQIRVIPLFLEGAHTRRDLAALIDAAGAVILRCCFRCPQSIGDY